MFARDIVAVSITSGASLDACACVSSLGNVSDAVRLLEKLMKIKEKMIGIDLCILY